MEARALAEHQDVVSDINQLSFNSTTAIINAEDINMMNAFAAGGNEGLNHRDHQYHQMNNHLQRMNSEMSAVTAITESTNCSHALAISYDERRKLDRGMMTTQFSENASMVSGNDIDNKNGVASYEERRVLDRGMMTAQFSDNTSIVGNDIANATSTAAGSKELEGNTDTTALTLTREEEQYHLDIARKDAGMPSMLFTMAPGSNLLWCYYLYTFPGTFYYGGFSTTFGLLIAIINYFLYMHYMPKEFEKQFWYQSIAVGIYMICITIPWAIFYSKGIQKMNEVGNRASIPYDASSDLRLLIEIYGWMGMVYGMVAYSFPLQMIFSWPLLRLSILRSSEGLQSGETAEGFRLLFLYDKSCFFAL